MDKFEIVKLIHEVEKTENKTIFLSQKKYFSGNILYVATQIQKRGY